MKRYTIALLLLVPGLAGTANPPKTAPARTLIPKIARMFGVQVGLNGQAALERMLGPGNRGTGGHSNSREAWRTRSPQGTVDTDGFSTNDEGYVIEDLSWELGKAPKAIPVARRLPRRSGWMGVVDLGASMADVDRLTRNVLPPPKKDGDVWTWTARGFARPKIAHLQDPYRDWTATLTFENKHLVQIDLNCR